MKTQRIIAALMCLLFCGALLSGCTSYESSLFDSVNQNQQNPWFYQPEDPVRTARATARPTAVPAPTPTPGIAPYRTPEPGTDTTEPVGATPTAVPSSPDSGTGFDGRTDISYVLIYNPNTLEDGHIYSLNTGYLGSQVDTGQSRADDLDSESPSAYTVPQDRFRLPEGVSVDLHGSRPGGASPVYAKGDTHQFYATVNGMNRSAELVTFTCKYAGEHCYIWVHNDSLTEASATSIGREFDTVIYPTDIELFGQPRYADEGGKISLLYYRIGVNSMVAGYFFPYELLATGEMSESDAANNGINLDHAIIHLNSDFATDEYADFMYSTTAHELQHLINCTNTYIAADAFNGTWINEAMSGFVEEYIYTGVQKSAGRYRNYASSYLIEEGQSLYNFYNNSFDIGVYGSVFLFSEYLANLAGTDTYRNYHTYWRMSAGRTITDAEALYNSVPASVQSSVISKYSYPSQVRFDNTYDEWLSKLTLDFYLSLLKYDAGDPAQYADLYPIEYMLYGEINDADIESGGRIILATVSGTFTIPDDAETGLIYIGFDSDLNQVTDLIYH